MSQIFGVFQGGGDREIVERGKRGLPEKNLFRETCSSLGRGAFETKLLESQCDLSGKTDKSWFEGMNVRSRGPGGSRGKHTGGVRRESKFRRPGGSKRFPDP